MPLQVWRVASAFVIRSAEFGREMLGDLRPGLAEAGGRLGPDQAEEFIRGERETALGVELPGKAQRVSARFSRGDDPGVT